MGIRNRFDLARNWYPFYSLQGTTLHPTEHWLGVSREKRLVTMAGSLALLAQTRVYRRDLERLVGKDGGKVSDAVLDACLKVDPKSKARCCGLSTLSIGDIWNA